MKRRSYNPRTLPGAVKRIRELVKEIEELKALLVRIKRERRLLAKLASEKPEFFNPFDVAKAQKLRDRILTE